MKRLFAIFVIFVMVLCMVPFTAQAVETDIKIEHFEDGSYLVTELEVRNTRMLTKVGSKSHTYYSADDVIQWKVSVTGEYLYDGTTVTCTYAGGTTIIYEPYYWSKVSDSSGYSGNAATYVVTMNKRALGVTLDTFTRTVTLYCDKDGNLS